MQIRKRGNKFQLLRRREKTDIKKGGYDFIGSIPCTCKDIEDVKDEDKELYEQLTKGEADQLRDYLNRKSEKVKKLELDTILREVPEMLRQVSEAIEQGDVEYEINDFLEAYKIFAKALGSKKGAVSQVVEITFNSIVESITENFESKNIELENGEALLIMQSLREVEGALEKQGYSSKWYKSECKQ